MQRRRSWWRAHGRTLASDVLKVAHHGSRTSSTEGLLRAVAPWLSVISAGRANRFGHPHGDVVQRLSERARNTLRIDEVGGVRVVSDGNRLRVSAWDPDVALSHEFTPGAASRTRHASLFSDQDH